MDELRLVGKTGFNRLCGRTRGGSVGLPLWPHAPPETAKLKPTP